MLRSARDSALRVAAVDGEKVLSKVKGRAQDSSHIFRFAKDSAIRAAEDGSHRSSQVLASVRNRAHAAHAAATAAATVVRHSSSAGKSPRNIRGSSSSFGLFG